MKKRILIRTDLDLIEMMDLDASPTDRFGRADILIYDPSLVYCHNKLIILNHYYPNSSSILRKLSENNRIISRIPDYKEFEYVPYDLSRIDIISTTNESVRWDSKDYKLVLLDDLLISNKIIVN